MRGAQAQLSSDMAVALQDHQAGRLLEAEEACRRILAVWPDDPDALHLLGVVAHQLGRPGEAVALLRRALELQPTRASCHCNLGEAHRALGELEQAIACQRRALALAPRLAEAHNNLGLALQHTGRHADAKACYLRALKLDPALADAQVNLGNLLALEGRPVQATERFERALELAPHSAQAHYNLANALRGQGLLPAAARHYRHALAIDPGYVEAHNNLGLALCELGEIEDAVRCFEAAVALDAANADALNNLGLACQARGDLAAARVCFERALAVRPELAPARCNLGALQQHAGDLDAALASFRHAASLDPRYARPHRHLGHILKEQERLEDALAAFLHALELDPDDAEAGAQAFYLLQRLCRWDRLEALRARLDRQTEALLAAGARPRETPFGSLGRCSEPARHLAIARAWAQEIERQAARAGILFSGEGRRSPRARLRLGYLSANFDEHPVAHQIQRLLELHDRDRFEVHAYGYGEVTSAPARAGIAAAADRFVDLQPLTDVEAARRIFRDEIDILIDLTGYTRGARIQIAALRPAPVQVGYLGFLGTTGGGFMDYVIADRVCVPPRDACHFTEQLVTLPECCLVFGEAARPVNHYKRCDFGLPDEGFVFVSMNASHKLEPVMFDLWMALLRAVPGSVLWLIRPVEGAVANLRRAAQARQVNPYRLVFADHIPYDENLKRLQLADLGLDTRVYNGGLTTANALWAGVPVLTLEGTDFVSRMGASMLQTLGLPELVASSPEQYRERALRAARDPGHLLALKVKLERQLRSAPLFDTRRFTRQLESAYEAMWRRCAAGESPAPIEVAPLPSS